MSEDINLRIVIAWNVCDSKILKVKQNVSQQRSGSENFSTLFSVKLMLLETVMQLLRTVDEELQNILIKNKYSCSCFKLLYFSQIVVCMCIGYFKFFLSPSKTACPQFSLWTKRWMSSFHVYYLIELLQQPYGKDTSTFFAYLIVATTNGKSSMPRLCCSGKKPNLFYNIGHPLSPDLFLLSQINLLSLLYI